MLAVLFALPALSAQDYQPTCKMCPATYVSNDECAAVREAGD